MRKMIYVFCLIILSSMASAQSVTGVKIKLHSVAELSLVEEVECIKERQDLLLRISLRSFEALGEGFIRVLDSTSAKNSSYFVVKNGKEIELNKKQGAIIADASSGSHEHVITMRIKNAPISQCQEALRGLIFSLEPK